MKILVADDDALNRRVAAAILSRAGHAVVAVPDGNAAIQAAAEGGFDLILLDVQMGGLDGPAAARAIRGLGVVETPILALSASGFAADIDTCLAAGMNGFLVKPLTLEALDAVLRGGGPAEHSAEEGLLDPARLAVLADELPAELMRLSLAACLRSLDDSTAALARAADAASVAAIAHRIAGTAATYGLSALRSAALAAEAAAKAPAAGFAGPLARLRDLLPPSRAALERHALRL